MSNLLKNTIFAIAAISLAAFLIHGCSSDDCPTCPEPGGAGGASISLDLMHPQPAPGYYTDAWAAGPNDVFVSAAEGMVLRWQGTGWTRYNTGNPMLFHAIWGTSASDVFAVGELGEIVHFDGSSWSTQPTGTFNTLQGVHGLSPDTVYAVGEFGTILRYDGSGWSAVDTRLPLDQVSLWDIWVSGPDFITAAGGDWSQPDPGMLLITNDAPWFKFNLPTPYFTSIHGWESDSLAIGDSRGQLRWFFNRNTVTTNPSDVVGDDIRSIWGKSPSDVWVGGYEYDNVNYRNIGVLKHNDGALWTDAAGMPIDYPVQGLTGVSASEAYMCGDGNTLARFDGLNWTRLNDEWITGDQLATIWGTASGELYAFGHQDVSIYYDGTEWMNARVPSHNGIRAAWGFADTIYAVGNGGVILHFDGAIWSQVLHGLTSSTLESVWGTGPDDIWAGAGPGQMLHFDGAGWELRDTWPSNFGPARSLWGSAPDDWYAVHYNGALHYDGIEWSKVELDGVGVNWVSGVSASEVYFLSGGGGGPASAPGKDGLDKVGRTPARSNLLRYNGGDYTYVLRDVGAYLLKVWALGSNNIFILGYSSASVPLIAHYNGAGLSMKEFDVNAYSEGFFCTAPNTAYTAGSMGTVMRATAR